MAPKIVRRPKPGKRQIRDIRKHMISNDQTDINKFEYSYQPYPKILTDAKGKALKDDQGESVKVYDRAEELEMYKQFDMEPPEEAQVEEEVEEEDEEPVKKAAPKKKGK